MLAGDRMAGDKVRHGQLVTHKHVPPTKARFYCNNSTPGSSVQILKGTLHT